MFFRKKPRFDLNSFKRKRAEFEITVSMCDHGWRLWPANATEQGKQSAIERNITTGEHRWYAPGEIEEPIVTEGKLTIKENK